MMIREYMPQDLEALTALFYNTVHTVNAKDYSKEQLDAWADGDADLDAWNESLSAHYSLVALEDDKVVGFGDIDEETGYLDRLFVHADYQRRGAASAICDKLEQHFWEAQGVLTGMDDKERKIITHASITAKPFFEKRGYKVVCEQQVERHGVFLTNFVMEKSKTG